MRVESSPASIATRCFPSAPGTSPRAPAWTRARGARRKAGESVLPRNRAFGRDGGAALSQ